MKEPRIFYGIGHLAHNTIQGGILIACVVCPILSIAAFTNGGVTAGLSVLGTFLFIGMYQTTGGLVYVLTRRAPQKDLGKRIGELEKSQGRWLALDSMVNKIPAYVPTTYYYERGTGRFLGSSNPGPIIWLILKMYVLPTAKFYQMITLPIMLFPISGFLNYRRNFAPYKDDPDVMSFAEEVKYILTKFKSELLSMSMGKKIGFFWRGANPFSALKYLQVYKGGVAELHFIDGKDKIPLEDRYDPQACQAA